MQLLFYSSGVDQSHKRLKAAVHKVIPEGQIEPFKSLGKFGFPGKGPSLIITDFGVYGFNKNTYEMILREMYPGVAVKDVKANIGWDVKVSRRLETTVPPIAEELQIIRRDLDPGRTHLR